VLQIVLCYAESMHNTTYQYRLRPTPGQITALETILGECRWLYNRLLEECKAAWEERGESLGLYDQINHIPALKEERPSLALVHSQVLQNVAVRLDLAFQAFFRRVRAGEKPGYPRFRGQHRYDSFCYPGSGYSPGAETVKLSKVGQVRITLHRPIEGTIKTCCIRRSSTGKWYVTFSCQVDDSPLPATGAAVGIDVGLYSFAMTSDGLDIENPRFFRTEEPRLAKAQRRLSREAKGAPARQERRKVVAHIHERIANRRKDFAHQESRKIVNTYSIIAVEDLSIHRMMHNHCLAKSIHDAAWGQFAACLMYKAEEAGRQYVAVNPAHTSQDCSNPKCGHRQSMPLSERMFACPCCHLVLPRDINAAKNILRLGLQSLGANP